MQKKGDFDITVFQWAFSLILAVAVVAALVVFIENNATGVYFKKNVLVRDVALLVNALYMAPGDVIVSYPLNEALYKLRVGRLPEGFRVVALAENEPKEFQSKYAYAEDTNFEGIDFEFQKDYDVHGLLLAKTNKGISIFDTANDIDSSLKWSGKAKISEYASSMKVAWPVKVGDRVVTSCYGNRKSLPRSWTECGNDHCGIDIRAVDKSGKAAQIVSIGDGIVKSVDGKYGAVAIQHGKILARYVHFDSIYVKANNIVKKNDVIGVAGSKGLESTSDSAVHLHFSTMVDGTYFDPVEVGLFDVNELQFKRGSNCLENKYSYSSIIAKRISG